jgi:creatinine amidohydrolase
MTTSEPSTPSLRRPIDEGDWNMAYLFPAEVAEARRRNGLVILPVAPIEWHGPHLAMGCDNLLAHAFARRLALALECPYYPPLFVGTERERSPEMLEAIGFERNAYVEGMDFPRHEVASAYFREEVFALVVREALNVLLGRMLFRRVLIVNGHGADNQRAVLDRLCREFNASSPAECRVMWVYPVPRSMFAGAIGHAASEETSMLAATWPSCVDLARLPASGPLRNIDHGVVDGETFDGQPTPDHTLRADRDPRAHTDASRGLEQIERAARETIEDVTRAWAVGGRRSNADGLSPRAVNREVDRS